MSEDFAFCFATFHLNLLKQEPLEDYNYEEEK